jgi:hypothetical protein
MESVTCAKELEAAFERGRAVGRVEGLAFKGVRSICPWTLGAQVRFSGGWFQSYVNYERDVLEELRRVQRGRWNQRVSLREREARLAAARRVARDAPGQARDLPWVQRRWLLWSRPWLDDVAHAEVRLADDHRLDAALRILEQNISEELSKVRAAVDSELEEGPRARMHR